VSIEAGEEEEVKSEIRLYEEETGFQDANIQGARSQKAHVAYPYPSNP